MISIRKVKNHVHSLNRFETKSETEMKGPKHHPFQFSKKMDYGLFLMVELAKVSNDEPLSLRTVAEQNQLSFFFLQKVALELRQKGLIQASRGKNGGYLLNKSANFITLKDILVALEGPVAIMDCLNHENGQPVCVRKNHCTMRNGLALLNQMLINILAKTTLLQLLQPTWTPKI